MNVLGFGDTAPGSMSDSWPVFRPLSGIVFSVVPEITCPTVVDSVCKTGVSLVTSTVSAIPPSSSLKSRRTTCFASTWIGLVEAVLNRESSALTTYVPTGSEVIVVVAGIVGDRGVARHS